MPFKKYTTYVVFVFFFLHVEYWRREDLQFSILYSIIGINQCVSVFDRFYWRRNTSYHKYHVMTILPSVGKNVKKISWITKGFYCLFRASDVSNWTKMETKLEAKGSNPNSRLQLKTDKKGIIWFDQVSLMPTDTYKVKLPIFGRVF